jgi:hypothetical protein
VRIYLVMQTAERSCVRRKRGIYLREMTRQALRRKLRIVKDSGEEASVVTPWFEIYNDDTIDWGPAVLHADSLSLGRRPMVK